MTLSEFKAWADDRLGTSKKLVVVSDNKTRTTKTTEKTMTNS